MAEEVAIFAQSYYCTKRVTSQNQLPFHEIDKLKKGSAIFKI